VSKVNSMSSISLWGHSCPVDTYLVEVLKLAIGHSTKD